MAPPRAYEQTWRATQTAARRAELVETARRLIEKEGFRGASLDAVAHAAGVARKTLYNQFGSKLGLLEAVLDAVAERGEVWRTADGADGAGGAGGAGAAATVAGLLEASCAFWAAERVLLRRLVGLAAVDPEAAAAVATRERRRARAWTHVAERLRDAGHLRDVSAEDAARALAQLSSFATFDGLTPARGDAGETARLLVRLAGGIVDAGALSHSAPRARRKG